MESSNSQPTMTPRRRRRYTPATKAKLAKARAERFLRMAEEERKKANAIEATTFARRRRALLGDVAVDLVARNLPGASDLLDHAAEMLRRDDDRALLGLPPLDEPASDGRTWLNVSRAEKDQAKALGARWDPNMARWFVPAATDLAPFERWLPTAKPQATTPVDEGSA